MEFTKTTLGEISIGKGQYGIGASAVDYSQDLYTYLRITDINDDGTLNILDLKSVDDPKASDYLLSPNDIVFARTGNSTGRNYFYDGSDGEFVYAGFLIKFSLDPIKVNPRYIKYYCLSDEYKGWVQGNSTGSTRGNINAQTYAGMDILLPPREQQDKLVKILDDLEAKRKTNSAINRNLEEQALALYYRMFVETKNDGRTICRTDEFFEITIGKTPPRKEKEWFSEIPSDCVWISISDMGSSGTFINDSSEYLTPEAVEKFNVKVVPDNTVILSFKLTVGRIAITVGPTTTNEAIAHFNTDNQKIVEYLYCYLKSFDFGALGSTSSIGIAVNSKTIKAMDFLIPEDGELQEFFDIVHPMFQQIKNNQFENQRLIAMRDSLLPKLMSGELDVSDIEI